MFRFGGPDDRPVHAGLPKGAAVANQVSRLKNVTVHQPELAHAAGGGHSGTHHRRKSRSRQVGTLLRHNATLCRVLQSRCHN